MACYVGHCNLRRWVMGDGGLGPRRHPDRGRWRWVELLHARPWRPAPPGFSSTHASTHNDGDNHPVPSRFAEPDELLALADELGRVEPGDHHLPAPQRGGRARPRGHGPADRARPGEPAAGHHPGSRRPQQGRRPRRRMGRRPRVPGPGRGPPGRPSTRCCWPAPSTGPSPWPRAPPSTRGCRRGTGWWPRRWPTVGRLLADPEVRGAMRHAVEHPNRDPEPRLHAAPAALGRAVRGVGRRPGARRRRGPVDRSTSPPSRAWPRPTP